MQLRVAEHPAAPGRQCRQAIKRMRKPEDRRPDPDTESRPDNLGTALAMWMPIGAGGGVALGLALGNLALGIALGTALGVTIACATGQRRTSGERPPQGMVRLALWLLLGLGMLVLAGAIVIALLRDG